MIKSFWFFYYIKGEIKMALELYIEPHQGGLKN